MIVHLIFLHLESGYSDLYINSVWNLIKDIDSGTTCKHCIVFSQVFYVLNVEW